MAPRRPFAWNRLLAWAIDCLCILGWVLITAAVGVPLYLTGVVHVQSQVVLNAVAALVVVVPVTLAIAVLESGARGASVGKRARRLVVVDATTGSALPFLRSLLRTGIKILLPWLLGHVAVYGLVRTSSGAVPGWVLAVTCASYLLPIVWVISLFIGHGRTPYDIAARTVVTRATGAANQDV